MHQLSKKESFFQFLFIQSINNSNLNSINNSLLIENKTEFNKNNEVLSSKKSSSIVPLESKFSSFSNKNQLKLKTINSQAFLLLFTKKEKIKNPLFFTIKFNYKNEIKTNLVSQLTKKTKKIKQLKDIFFNNQKLVSSNSERLSNEKNLKEILLVNSKIESAKNETNFEIFNSIFLFNKKYKKNYVRDRKLKNEEKKIFPNSLIKMPFEESKKTNLLERSNISDNKLFEKEIKTLQNIKKEKKRSIFLDYLTIYQPYEFSISNFNNQKQSSKTVLKNRNKSSNDSIYNIFLTYKKSFLCYWLLPFLGFVSLANFGLETTTSSKLINLNSIISEKSTNTNLRKNNSNNLPKIDLFGQNKINETKGFFLSPMPVSATEVSLVPIPFYPPVPFEEPPCKKKRSYFLQGDRGDKAAYLSLGKEEKDSHLSLFFGTPAMEKIKQSKVLLFSKQLISHNLYKKSNTLVASSPALIDFSKTLFLKKFYLNSNTKKLTTYLLPFSPSSLGEGNRVNKDYSLNLLDLNDKFLNNTLKNKTFFKWYWYVFLLNNRLSFPSSTSTSEKEIKETSQNLNINKFPTKILVSNYQEKKLQKNQSNSPINFLTTENSFLKKSEITNFLDKFNNDFLNNKNIKKINKFLYFSPKKKITFSKNQIKTKIFPLSYFTSTSMLNPSSQSSSLLLKPFFLLSSNNNKYSNEELETQKKINNYLIGISSLKPKSFISPKALYKSFPHFLKKDTAKDYKVKEGFYEKKNQKNYLINATSNKITLKKLNFGFSRINKKRKVLSVSGYPVKIENKEKNQTPHQSLKKASFLLDHLILNDLQLTNFIGNLLKSNLFINPDLFDYSFSNLNSSDTLFIETNKIKIDSQQAKTLNENLILILKKPSFTNSSLSMPILSLQKKDSENRIEDTAIYAVSSKEKEKLEKESFLSLNNTPVLYNCIFKGLKNNLNKVIETSLFSNSFRNIQTPVLFEKKDVNRIFMDKFRKTNDPLTLPILKLNIPILGGYLTKNKISTGSFIDIEPPTKEFIFSGETGISNLDMDNPPILARMGGAAKAESPNISLSPLLNLSKSLNFNKTNKNNEFSFPVLANKMEQNKKKLLKDNSFLFFSKYIELLTNNIKLKLKPYRNKIGQKYLVMTTFPYLKNKNIKNKEEKEAIKPKVYIQTNKFEKLHNYKKKINLSPFFAAKNKKEKLFFSYTNFVKKSKFEKLFLSYLSKSKLGSQSDFVKRKERTKLTKTITVLSIPITLKKLTENKLTPPYISFQEKLKKKSLDKKRKEQSFYETNKLNIKSFNLINKSTKNQKSFLMKLKNKLFVNKKRNNEYWGNLINPNQESIENQNKIEETRRKKQHLKLKRRLKKMQCATRRRKKRKIFYPRPKWLTFSMYDKFLNLRFNKTNLPNTEPFLLSHFLYNPLTSQKINEKNISQKLKLRANLMSFPRNLSNASFQQVKNEITKKNLFSFPLPPVLLFPEGKKQPPHLKVSSKGGCFARGTFLKKSVAFFKGEKLNYWNQNSKDFYTTSHTVFRDLRRILMKSNWLKNYLNPYLEKIKYIYNEMENDSKKITLFKKLRYFSLSLYGSFFNLNQINGEDSIQIAPTMSKNYYQNLNPLSSVFFTKDKSLFIAQKTLQELQENKNKQNEFKQYNSILNFEYNRILYQRIQRLILNIRDNLNINGQIKNRSKKLGKNIRPFIKRDYIKRDINIPPNQTENIWGNLFKKNLLKLTRSFGLLNKGYEEPSFYTIGGASQNIIPFVQNNLHWALNKTENFLTSNTTVQQGKASYSKKLWEKYKIREINKNNKTKKMIFDIFMKYNNILNDQNSLDEYTHLLESDLTQTKKLYKKNFNILKINQKQDFFYEDNINIIIDNENTQIGDLQENQSVNANQPISIFDEQSFASSGKNEKRKRNSPKKRFQWNEQKSFSEFENSDIRSLEFLEQKLLKTGANNIVPLPSNRVASHKNNESPVSSEEEKNVSKEINEISTPFLKNANRYSVASTKNYIDKSEKKLINIENKLKLLGLYSTNSLRPSYFYQAKKTSYFLSNPLSKLKRKLSSKKVFELISSRRHFYPALSSVHLNAAGETLLKKSVAFFKDTKSKIEGLNKQILRISPLRYKKIYFRFLKQELLKEKQFFLPYSYYRKSFNTKRTELDKFYLLKSTGLKKKQSFFLKGDTGIQKLQQLFFNIKQKSLNNLAGIKISNNIQNSSKISNNTYWWTNLNIELPNQKGFFSLKMEEMTSPSFLSSTSHVPFSIFNPISIKVKTKGFFEKKELEKLTNFHINPSLTLISVLFHFCALISFISLGGVRSVIKFYYILLSKTYKIINKLRFIKLFPTNVQKSSFNKLAKLVLMNKTSLDLPDQTSLSYLIPRSSITDRKTKQKNASFSPSPKSVTFSPFTFPIPFFPLSPFPLRGTGGRGTKGEKGGIGTGDNLKIKNVEAISKLKSKQLTSKKLINSFKIIKVLALKYLISFSTNSNTNRPFPLSPFPLRGTGGRGTGRMEGINGGIDNLSTQIYREKQEITAENLLTSKYLKKQTKNLINLKKEIKNLLKLFFNTSNLLVKDPQYEEKIQFSTIKTQKFEKDSQSKISNFLWIKKSNNNFSSFIFLNAYIKSFVDTFLLKNKSNEKQSIAITKSQIERFYPQQIKIFYNLNLSIGLTFVHKVSFYTYLLLLKSVDILTVPALLIYKFFEKPGEYVVENLAYSFLLEWSADLISTIPDTIDTSFAVYFSKINRTLPFYLFINTNINKDFYNLINISLSKTVIGMTDFSKIIFGTFLFGVNNSIIQRVTNSSLLLFIQQLAEPDLDYINRQKKGIIFWDIWGDCLKTIAEENSVNIYELSTDKEEQLKLLSNIERVEELKRLSSTNNNPKSLVISNSFSLNPFTLKNTNNSFIPLEFNWKTERKNKPDRWSVNQFLNYQGKDTDLFIDLHPPRTFLAAASSLKYSFSVQAPIGSIVCQIFGGIFYKQISKNVLVVLHNSNQNNKGLEKSLLIQAIAGETELKIITDNAHRYAMVIQGVAVGIKLLKDVFEALCAAGPCLFLMEDIHAIGQRRPFLIDEASPNLTESIYNKNQSMQGFLLKEKSNASREILYKTNKHLLTNYKKPYKEFKSLSSNHFSFTFLYRAGNFLKIRSNNIKSTEIPLAIQVSKKENELTEKNGSFSNVSSGTNNKKGKGGYPSDLKNGFKSIKRLKTHNFESDSQTLTDSAKTENQTNIYSSFSLLIDSLKTKQSLINPPASSPFNLLLMKEATKLKHNQNVREMSWFGLPGEQYSLISKSNYSIRVKVALLADLVLSNLAVKLEMITDLLVIIDSVKGNRGFVIFATTHLPDILDPALRRPGRFDETISLPLIPALYSRWTNYRYNVQYLTSSLFKNYSFPLNSTFNKGTTLDLSKYSFCYNDSQFEALFPLYSSTINYISQKQRLMPYSKKRPFLKNDFYKKAKTSFVTDLHYQTVKNLLQIFYSRTTSYASHSIISLMLYNLENKQSDQKVKNRDKKLILKWPTMLKESKLNNNFIENYSIYLSLFGQTKLNFENTQDSKKSNKIEFGHIIFMSFIASKLGENFGLSSNLKKQYALRPLLSSPLSIFSKMEKKDLVTGQRKMENQINNQKVSKKKLSPSPKGEGDSFFLQKDSIFSKINPNPFLFNFNQNAEWKKGSSLLYSYIQKRLPYFEKTNFKSNLNFLTFYSSKLLNFNNKYSLMEAPSPPISNILLPAKRYENYKRTFSTLYNLNFETNKTNDRISEKIKLHQQQRLLKRLYNYPIKEFFRNEKIASFNQLNFDKIKTSFQKQTPEINHHTNLNFANFNQSYLVFAEIENLTQKNFASLNQFSSFDHSYRNILYNRHRTYLTNQWWNGQQGEHNSETTFLSDIDWRYTQISKIKSTDDIQIDFPDCEQFYNPRNRRWILTKGDWNYWFNIETDLKDIYSHYINESLAKAYKCLDQNREFLDLYSNNLLQSSFNLMAFKSIAIENQSKVKSLNLKQSISFADLNQREILNLYKRFFYARPYSVDRKTGKNIS